MPAEGFASNTHHGRPRGGARSGHWRPSLHPPGDIRGNATPGSLQVQASRCGDSRHAIAFRETIGRNSARAAACGLVPMLVLAAGASAGTRVANAMTTPRTGPCPRSGVPNKRIEARSQPDTTSMPQERQRIAVELLLRFAERTGLTGSGAPRRYLWTDAFAVCSFLGLTRVTGDGRYEGLALRLVDRVHHTLGRHRLDDPRTGWISGLSTREGEAHPTRGGLRIGKALPERRPGEPGQRPARVGAGRPVLPLPDQVDARPGPGDTSDGTGGIQPVGARARRDGARRLHPCARGALACACTGR